MLWRSRIYVTGFKDELVWRIIKELRRQGHNNLIENPANDFSLFSHEAVHELFNFERPEYVFFVSSSCSDLKNSFFKSASDSKACEPGICEIRYKRSLCELNVIHAARENYCRKFLFIDSKKDSIGSRYCADLAREEGACFLSLQYPPLNSSVAMDNFAAHCVELMKKPFGK